MPKLRLMTYNVRYFSHGTRGVLSTAWAMNGIAEAVAGLDELPDIVCLQELETQSMRANLAHPPSSDDDTQLSRLMLRLHAAIEKSGRRDTYAAYYFPAHTYRLTSRKNIYTTGLAILAKQELRVVRHNAGEPADITHRRIHLVRELKQTRISAHLRFEHRSGDTIDVFNTHLSLPAFWSKDFWRRGDRLGHGQNQLSEAKNLADFVEQERASDRYIVVGDFNALPGSPTHRYLVEERGMRDAFIAVDGRSIEEAKRWPTAGFLHLRMRLDHVLAGPGIEWIDFADSAPFGEKESRWHGLSDHVPLVARCRVSG